MPLRLVRTASISGNPISFGFSSDKNKKYRVIEDPADISKLVFNSQGLCKIYDYRDGEYTLRKVVRYIALLTFINGILFGMEIAKPSRMRVI